VFLAHKIKICVVEKKQKMVWGAEACFCLVAPSNNTASSVPTYHQHSNRPAVSAGTNDIPFLSLDPAQGAQSDLRRHPQSHVLVNNGNNVGHNPNKRVSVDLGCSLSDYAGKKTEKNSTKKLKSIN
jgi:hypothetical protein